MPEPSDDNAPGGLTLDQCLSLHEEAQEHRLASDLLAARLELRACAASSCPAMIRSDCGAWLGELERLVPTLVFELGTDQTPPEGIRFFVNGAPSELILGRPIPFDPGAVSFKFEAAGHRAQTETIVIREGEKNRVILINFSDPAPPGLASAPVAAVGEDPYLEPSTLRVGGYVLAGVSLVSAGAAAWLAADGIDDVRRARASCSPLCEESDSDEARRKLVLADAAGATAVISGGLALAFFLLLPEEHPHPVAVAVEPNGGSVMFAGGF